MKRVDGLAVSVDTSEPLLALLEGPAFDAKGYQRAKRINGACVCPDCGLVWPNVEDVEVWRQDEKHPGRWLASEWGTGTAWCEVCDIAMVEGLDRDYVIRTRTA